MEQGSKDLIIYLLTHENTELLAVARRFRISEDELLDWISKINHLLKQEKIFIHESTIRLTEKGREECYRLLTAEEEMLFTYYEVKLRRQLILIQLLMEPRFLSLKALADYVYVSKNTVLNDVKWIRNHLNERRIHLEYSRKEGYAVNGAEFLIRSKLAELLREVIKIPYGKFVLDEKNLITVSETFLLKKRLESVEKRLQVTFTDEQMEELPYILVGTIKRAEVLRADWSFQLKKYDLKNTKEYPVIKEMFWGYDFLSEADYLYLALQVLASSLLESVLYFSESDEIADATTEFIQQLEIYFATEFAHKAEFKEKVMLHVRPAVYRNLLGFQIVNPLAEQFKTEYLPTFQIVKKAAAPFERLVGHAWSEEEIVFLSMIVLAWMYQEEESAEPVFSAAVLCQSGTSISKLLIENLKMMFPTIDFKGAYAVRQLPEVEGNLDFIFTTVPVQSQATVFVVPPILGKLERKKLRRQLEQAILLDEGMRTKELMAMLKEAIPSEKRPFVEQQLNQFFMKKPQIEKAPKEMVIFEEQISFLEDATWESIVEEAFEPLLKRGSVTWQYVEKCRAHFYDHYETMMIGPNIYLPHASPGDGVLNADIQIVRLKTPVETPCGSEVDIVVALAPSEKNRHISLLLKLNELFLDEKKRRLVLSAENQNELYEMIDRG
ncbi:MULTISPECIES: BglG family transcription antiterminator [unclassified Listeria]|uniref:BglG family transcription antiterminator n=1 Tax=unclassified Listeria TaxID=2642072 RepID=UPI000B5933C2|nr:MULTISPECIES: PRD domain-containing protein [unclassified Listeria]